MKKSLAEIGYSSERNGNTTIIYKSALPGLPGLIEKQRTAPVYADLRGRAQIRILEPDMVERTLTHGGLMRHITGKRFFSPARSLRELEISNYLIAMGIPTPEILALRLKRKGLFHNIAVVSKLVPESVDLLTYLEDSHEDVLSIFKQTGSLIQKIHASGVHHADLHIKNILLDKNKTPWVLDLDKAYRFSSLGFLLRYKARRRFIHSCKKWQKRNRITLPDGWEDALRKGYDQQGAGW